MRLVTPPKGALVEPPGCTPKKRRRLNNTEEDDDEDLDCAEKSEHVNRLVSVGPESPEQVD